MTSFTWKFFLLVSITLLTPIFIYADGWTSSNPSHSTLYADTITSKTDGSSINIADSQGLFVTGDITSLGKVGIGTTSPTSRLQVKGLDYDGSAGEYGGPLTVETSDAPAVDKGGSIVFGGQTGNGNPDYAFGMVKGAKESAAPENYAGYLAFYTVPPGSSIFERMRITGAGNVGIGTASPGYKFDVAGDAHATSFPTSSDIRLKKNIIQLTNVLDKLQNIHGVKFEWNDKYKQLGRATNGTQIGVVAQELEKEFPELVTTWGNESYRAVDYGRFSAVLLEAIKELKDEIELLNAENKDKDVEIQQLKAKNEKLTTEIVEIKSKLKEIKN